MLTKMTLTNFLSFKEETVFDFTPTKYTILSETNTTHDIAEGAKLLKGALFIGPNASGKTNALRGITFLLRLIKGGDLKIANYRCLFARKETIKAVYEFSFNMSNVVYSVAYKWRKKELSEQLSVDGQIVLSRKGAQGELHIENTHTVDTQLDGETAFLRTASFNTGRFPQHEILHLLMEYILNSSYIEGDYFNALIGKTINDYAEQNGVEKINEYLKKFNYDFFAEYAAKSSGAGLTADFGDQKHVFFKRKEFPVPLPIELDAQGNLVFADMLPHLIDVIEKPGMLVIDEFGNSLHNYLAEKIVRFFMENAGQSQLFITSHCTNLISHSVFRPDQIVLVTFAAEHGSKIVRISKYKPREAQNLEKMYLGGMFEGLPNYGEEVQD